MDRYTCSNCIAISPSCAALAAFGHATDRGREAEGRRSSEPLSPIVSERARGAEPGRGTCRVRQPFLRFETISWLRGASVAWSSATPRLCGGNPEFVEF